MNLELNLVSPDSVCEGCLSVDRELTVVKDDESRKFFRGLLHPLEHVYNPLQLCWECTAIVRNSLRFRTQVQASHDYLVSYMLHQIPTLSSLSRLSINTQPNHDVPHSSANTYQNPEDHQYPTEHTQDPQAKILLNANEDLKGKYKGSERDETRPLAFIKIEDQEDFAVEWCNVDEIIEDCGDDDDKDLKAVLKSESAECDVRRKRNTKSKKTRRKKKEEFDESDDEPLTLKKKRETVAKESKSQRKGKKTEDAPTGVAKKPRREKPPGVVDGPRVQRKLQQLNVPPGQLEMVVLSWEEVAEERARLLSGAAFARQPHRCHDCALGFNHRLKLDNHMKKHDPSWGSVSCGVCRVRCRDSHALSAHKRRHRVRWRCMVCGALWSRAAVAADHCARAHGAQGATHCCSTCGHRASTLGKLRNHLKSHAERQRCDQCGKTFRDRTSLRTHLFIHLGEKEYSCPRCDKRFLFKKAMEVHLVTHEDSANLYCYTCDMTFKNRMSYYQHMKYNLKHVDPAKLKHACTVCDKRFVKATRLEEHNLAVHLKATPIRCTIPECSFACSSRPVLRTHVRMVHRGARHIRNHVCHTCGKTYTTKKSLEGHLRAHTGERPLRCAQCPAAFSYDAALYNHCKLVHHRAKKGKAPAPAEPTHWAPPLPAPTHTPQQNPDDVT